VTFIEKVAIAAQGPIGFMAQPKDADGPNPFKGGATFRYQQDAPSCSDCGSIMVRNGACYKCLNCGSTSGCS
ncbi:MAG: ribonucleoside-diphosphate reductase class, partial [Acidobacteria bacterium]|nr:ribonucleoside-diphosphate reductase class [Acidobacteriota bacterium]